ncbi:MAG: PhoH family protein [bacterium]|nr:PhoH family protein [bacterium]
MILDTKLYSNEDVLNIAGGNESKLKIISSFYNTNITISGTDIIVKDISNEQKEELERIFTFLIDISKHVNISAQDITYILKMKDDLESLKKLYLNRKPIINNFYGKPIYPKTINQVKYLEIINDNDIIFSIGKAGSGKTFLAIVFAVKMLKEGKIKRIILTRPAVEAGESLGFLPGDLKEKIDPYLRPLYDGLYECMGREVVTELIDKQTIEIAPLAYMRGRTLDNAFIILDEAQNTTKMQMKMILSRLGYNSKMVITGDITQIDLPSEINSGLKNAIRILRNIKGISFIEFMGVDVIRHPLVNEILKRYDGE